VNGVLIVLTVFQHLYGVILYRVVLKWIWWGTVHRNVFEGDAQCVVFGRGNSVGAESRVVGFESRVTVSWGSSTLYRYLWFDLGEGCLPPFLIVCLEVSLYFLSVL
jgi:hypothetical protein